MRASPPIAVDSNRFGEWQAAVTAAALAAVAAMAAWIAVSAGQQAPLVLVGAGLATGVVAAAALGSARIAPVALRWDGLRWQLQAREPGAPDPVAGELQVAIDLGFWMLLRFVVDAAPLRRRVAWLPVQRRGLEAQWHALRCAVYAPRPAPDAR